jgi:hypothetical protein
MPCLALPFSWAMHGVMIPSAGFEATSSAAGYVKVAGTGNGYYYLQYVTIARTIYP